MKTFSLILINSTCDVWKVDLSDILFGHIAWQSIGKVTIYEEINRLFDDRYTENSDGA